MSELTASIQSFGLTPPRPLGEAGRTLERIQRQWDEEERIRPVPVPFDALAPAVARELVERWSRPCEAAFEHLVARHPGELLKWIRAGALGASELTFAAEFAGRVADSAAVRRTLLPLLAHASPLVREGAIYGLQPHADDEVRSRLRGLADHDSSPGVRAAALEALEDR